MYFHLAQVPQFEATPRTMNVVLRTAGPPTALTAAARETVGQLDPSLPLSGLRTMDQVLSISTARPRFLTLVMGVFAGLALTLAAVGTYGVMAYSVAQRGRKLGIRIALGAEHGRVLGLVMRQGLGLALVGLVLGTGGALVLAGVMESLLFEVQARDPLSFVLGPVLLGTVAVLACWIPARRATRVDPVTVLRED
jgi:putative ABC transport system permease protein